MPDHTLKLHAYIAQLGLASRRKAEQLIAEGKVKVNGQPAHVGQRITPGKDKIKLDGQDLVKEDRGEGVYYLVNKPVGYISTASDELDRKTVVDLVTGLKTRVYPVGRLDKDSQGLMLLTNDGDVAYILTHPKYEVEKTYKVLLQGRPSTPALNHLKRGVRLKEGYVVPKRVEIKGHDENKNTWLEITICEGKYQEIRRMIRRIGYEILILQRISMGPLNLGDIQRGQFQKLTPQQASELQHWCTSVVENYSFRKDQSESK